jgi:hypothetical protein
LFVQDIDCDSLQIEACWQEEEGQQKMCCEERLYEKLGLKDKDEKATKAREGCDRRGTGVVLNENGEEVLCADEVPDIGSFCDWTNLIMCLGSRYKYMHSFRLAMREYAIRNEFELGIESSSPIKYQQSKAQDNSSWQVQMSKLS